MATNQTKKESSTALKINKKPSMLPFLESCLSVPPVNTGTIKLPNHLSKLMTQMTWCLTKSEDKKSMLYQEKEPFLNFISGN